MARQLIICDVDGTLIDAWDFWTGAYRRTFERVFGADIGNFRDNYTPGDSVSQVIASNLLAHGYLREEIEPKLGLAAAAMSDALGTVQPHEVRVLPGVREFLSALPGATKAVMTGNTAGGGTSLLRAAGLIGYFSFVVGSEYGSREEKLREVMSRAGKEDSVSYRPKDVCYVDDSTASIPVSRKLGIRSIAVATGETSYDELVRQGPDLVLRDLTDVVAALRFIDGEPKRLNRLR
jgi:phosphoglycolate phosphatase